MYINQNASKKWIDPERRAELLKRDKIRQAYYARLEREKNGIFDENVENVENVEKPKRKKTKG